MQDQAPTNSAVAESIAKNIFQVMPLIKKRLIRLNAIQAEHGIPLSHVQVLAMLNETGSMSITEISRRFGIAKPNITPLVDRLIALGLVDRVRNNADRRVVNIVILKPGQDKLLEIQSSLNAHVLGWSTAIPAKDMVRLSAALEDITRILGAE